MTTVYVTGGRQGAPRPLLDGSPAWYHYEAGVILRVNTASGCVERCVEYVSPPGACAPGDPVLFKSGTVHEDRLYVCTQTELLIYELPHFNRVGYVSLPCFNDVHHVRPTPEGNLLVANSGLEMVLELAPGGKVLRTWNVLGEAPWARFSTAIDYRQGINLKPHRAHPNYVFYVGDEIWTTRFEQKDALSLTHPGRCLPIGIERVHDGVVHEGRLYLTAVDGHLIIADPAALAIEAVVDLGSFHPDRPLLGWCRGLLFEGDRVWIGFSRIRPTRFREAVSWVRRGFSQSRLTHIACYDLARRRCLAEIELENYGLHAVFSILPAGTAAPTWNPMNGEMP